MPFFPRTRFAVAVEAGCGVILIGWGLWHVTGKPDHATYKRLCQRAANKLGEPAMIHAANSL